MDKKINKIFDRYDCFNCSNNSKCSSDREQIKINSTASYPTDCGRKCNYALLLEQLIKELKNENIKLKKDNLTNVWNRHYLDEMLSTKYKDRIKKGWIYNVILIDLDGLHELNRTKGYEAGDEFIINVVEQIKKIMSENNVTGDIFRIGGDEFLIIYEPYDDINLDDIKNITYAKGYFYKGYEFRELMKKLDSKIIELKKVNGTERK
jgi:GGDEF domain-containing protein